MEYSGAYTGICPEPPSKFFLSKWGGGALKLPGNHRLIQGGGLSPPSPTPCACLWKYFTYYVVFAEPLVTLVTLERLEG